MLSYGGGNAFLQRTDRSMLGKEQKGSFCCAEGGRQIVSIKSKDKKYISVSIRSCLLITVYCLLFACATSSDLDMMRYDLNKVQRDSVSLRNDVNTSTEKTTGVAKEESFDVTGHVGLRPRAERAALGVEPGLVLAHGADAPHFVATAGGLLRCDGREAVLLTPLAVAGASAAAVRAGLEEALRRSGADLEVRRVLQRLETGLLHELRRAAPGAGT